MLAPLAASLFRYGACVITLERCLFSKITTTMWSCRGTADLSFVGAGGRPAACRFSGLGSTPASGVVSAPASGVGNTPASVMGSSMDLVSVGSVGTTVGMPLEVPPPRSMTDLPRHRPPIRTATFPQLPNRIVAKPAPPPEKPPPG